MEKMTLILSAARNYDFAHEPKMPEKQEKTVSSFAEASQVCRAWITEHDLGGGNWTGGQLFKGNKQIARVSYNGRVWDMDHKEIVI